MESSQLDALIINEYGLFEIGRYREVNEYDNFWAIGSGQQIALGAMYSLYDRDFNAQGITEYGVKAAAEFDEACGLPLVTKMLKLKKKVH